MAAAASKNIQLALALPTRLRTFLARYPPASILPAGATAETHKTTYQEETPNPFMPTKHAVTGRWHDPKYSLRRQAELVKLAREHGVEELLPFTNKGTETRLTKRVEFGLRVKGTGVGQKVKGHIHERRMIAKYDGEEESCHAGYAGPHPGMEEVLDLSPTTLSSQPTPASTTALLKLHYRRALLHHHPDKKGHHQPHQPHQPHQQQPKNKKSSTITIDQITTALTTLSHPALRAAYDQSLLQSPANPQSQQQGDNNNNFQTGIETLDLDDLASFTQPTTTAEGASEDEPETRWFRPCRCGNPRGFEFGEADLEDAADVGELMVGCADCSLWLRVHFAVVDEDEDDDDDEGDEQEGGGGGDRDGAGSGGAGKKG
ncbi:hypothetical protein C8A05DRAFT_40436 [Staphylotrichum tortipilum]|uniref:Diphthamide biosynthesis protein 4 n=1 Tax=Staphylotrichum tortipilum TaxID=2831512 RepID=A0AAN6MU86_9PEZI|nr:hypothetical protein C8A05DRAFT_40436 [Staphylotrichum longicolle]